MSPIRNLIIVPTILAVFAVRSAAADAPHLARIISVTGEGKTAAAPDMATITTGVNTQAESAKAALEQNNAAMEKVLSTLKEHDVADKDVQTSAFSVSPVYNHSCKGQTEPEVVAYRAQNQVQVTIRNLASLGKILDALVAAGSNQVSGISFGVGDPTGNLQEARSQAIRDAKSRADVYAQAAGVSVGPVLQISEQPIDPPRPMHFGSELRAAAASVPIAVGEQEYRVTVNVAYELRQPGEDEEQP